VWEVEPGPLHGITGHCWSALAVALTVADLGLDAGVRLMGDERKETR